MTNSSGRPVNFLAPAARAEAFEHGHMAEPALVKRPVLAAPATEFRVPVTEDRRGGFTRVHFRRRTHGRRGARYGLLGDNEHTVVNRDGPPWLIPPG